MRSLSGAEERQGEGMGGGAGCVRVAETAVPDWALTFSGAHAGLSQRAVNDTSYGFYSFALEEGAVVTLDYVDRDLPIAHLQIRNASQKQPELCTAHTG